MMNMCHIHILNVIDTNFTTNTTTNIMNVTDTNITTNISNILNVILILILIH